MKNSHYSRNFILNVWAEQPFWRFMTLIVMTTLAISTLIAFLFYSIGPVEQLHWRNLPLISDKPFLPCLKRAFLGLVTLSDDPGTCFASIAWLENLLSAITILFGVFFFASIVAFFTGVVLRPKTVFQLKRSLNIKFLNGSPRVYLSCYNASPTTISNLHIRMVARIRVNETTLRNVVLYDGSPVHPLAEPYIPLRVSAPLSENDLSIVQIDESGFVSLINHQRSGDIEPLPLEEIYADITGILVGIEQAVHGASRYFVGEQGIFHGPFESIDPDYEYARQKGMLTRLGPPREIIEKFNQNSKPMEYKKEKLYVFGYGSLVNPSSFSKTLQRTDWVAEDFPLATLQGYRRVWNVAMDNSQAISGYKRYSDADNPERYPECYVCFVNIEKAEEHSITGAIAMVTPEEMTRLKSRERNYDPVEVTSSMLNPPIDGRVYTFIGSKSAQQRFKRGLDTGTAVISADYQQYVEEAFRLRGSIAYSNYLESTEKPDNLKTRNLQLHRIK